MKQQIDQDIDLRERGNQVGEPYDNLLPGVNKLTDHLTYDKFTAWREFLGCKAGRVTRMEFCTFLEL